MKMFVLGRSGTGKTPLAKQTAAALGVPHVGASAWVRRMFPPLPDGAPPAERQRQIAQMTRFSLDELRRDPASCLDFLERHHDLARPCVIEGMRNPYDFVRTFDPRHDLAVILERRGSPLEKTGFEGGLDVIDAYLRWLVDNGLLDDDNVLDVAYDDAASLDDVIAQAISLGKGRFPHEPPVDAKLSRVHVDIPQLALSVKKPLVYGGDPRFDGEFLPCRAFAFSSYPGSAPTFQIVLGDGAVFSYVPPSALVDLAKRKEPELPLSDLVYHNCADGDVAVTTFSGLVGDVLCFFKHKELWLKGEYRFTVDWYRGNDLLHCVTLENGQVAFLPSHKIKFGGQQEPGFRPYKKLRNEWRV
jgi:hypothetical protein